MFRTDRHHVRRRQLETTGGCHCFRGHWQSLGMNSGGDEQVGTIEGEGCLSMLERYLVVL